MRQRMNITLLILYVLVIADFVVSIVWAGFAKTASGVPIPDSTLILPVIFFIAFCVLMEIARALCLAKKLI